mgnify:CR=1 FL=1
MALWGTDGDASTNKPKWCPDDANSKYDVTTVFGNQSGWVRRAGTSATGNGNTSADPEILVAIGGLAGATASTGLKHPTMTKYRILQLLMEHQVILHLKFHMMKKLSMRQEVLQH